MTKKFQRYAQDKGNGWRKGCHIRRWILRLDVRHLSQNLRRKMDKELLKEIMNKLNKTPAEWEYLRMQSSYNIISAILDENSKRNYDDETAIQNIREVVNDCYWE